MKVLSPKTIILKDNIQSFKVLGRINTADDGIALDFNSCSIEFCAECEGSVSLEFTLVGNGDFGIIVDDGEITFQSVTENKLILAENLHYGIHTFKVIKDKGVAATTASILNINGLLCQPPAAKPRVIEIVGDSITCGAENIIVVKTENGDVLKDTEGRIERVTLSFVLADKSEKFEYDIDCLSGENDTEYCITEPDGAEHTFQKSRFTAQEKFYANDGTLIAQVPFISHNTNELVSYESSGICSYSYILPHLLDYDWTIFSQSGKSIEFMYEQYYKQFGRNENAEYKPMRVPDVVFINLDTNSACDTESYKAAMKGFVSLFKAVNPCVKIVFALSLIHI